MPFDPKAPGGNTARNVLGGPLGECGSKPLTGFYRDGCCNTGGDDHGVHSVFALMAKDFLESSLARGNDLSTPMPDLGFPGLKAGDLWRLCAGRSLAAVQAGFARRVVLTSTHAL